MRFTSFPLGTQIPKVGHVFPTTACSVRQDNCAQGPFRHPGEGRNPVPLKAGYLDPGLRRGDDFGSFGSVFGEAGRFLRLHRIRDRN